MSLAGWLGVEEQLEPPVAYSAGVTSSSLSELLRYGHPWDPYSQQLRDPRINSTKGSIQCL